MDATAVAWYSVTNILSGVCWIILAVLIHMFRVQAWRKGVEATGLTNGLGGERAVVFSWIKPLTYAMKIFCAISAGRYFVNVGVVFVHELIVIQNAAFFLNTLSLAVAVAYASVFYNKIPSFLLRLKGHQEKSRRFTVIADASVDAFLETDEAANIWYANRAAGEILEYSEPKSLLGLNFIDDLVAPSDREKYAAMRSDYAAGGMPAIINRRSPEKILLRCENGREFPAEMTVTHYRVGETDRFCLIIRDTSYREKASGP